MEKKFVADSEKLMEIWNFNKNNKLNLYPEKLTCGSNKKVWWICKTGHEYQECVYWVSKGKECPICNNKRVLIGYNDLRTKFPELANEWLFEKNSEIIDINMANLGSARKVWWKCSKCGHEWFASIRSRTQRNSGCPECSKIIRGHKKQLNAMQKNGCIADELLRSEWDYEKNYPLTPDDIPRHSNKYAYWVCQKCKHSWRAKISNRTSLGRGCPVCSNREIVIGVNDLATTHPYLVKEWDFERNKDITPYNISHGSGKRVYWICPKGHKYQATVLHRTNGKTGCPICNAGRQTSFAEQAFFYYIKRNHPDAINRYKEIFNKGMELDIYIPSFRVGIEYDGSFWHKNKLEREQRKYKICKENNIRLIRIKESYTGNVDMKTCDESFSIDEKYSRKSLDKLISCFISKFELWNTDYKQKHPSIDTTRDEHEIMSYMMELKENSIEDEYPELVKEWDFEKNKNLKPSMFHRGSDQTVWWKCSKCSREWKTSISHRTIGKTGCPECSKKRVSETKRKLSKNIYQYTLSGEFIKEWRSVQDASEQLKISNSNICSCANGKRKNAGGYSWSYHKPNDKD